MLKIPFLGKVIDNLDRFIGGVVTDDDFKPGLAVLVVVHVGHRGHDSLSHLLLVVEREMDGDERLILEFNVVQGG